MGYYTEFRFEGKLKRDLPKEVDSFLKRILIDQDLGIPRDKVLFKNEDVFKPEFDHPFFKCERWYFLFHGKNFRDDMNTSKMFVRSHNWIINIHSEFKDYDDEIEKFIDWITPFLAGRKKKQYVGWREGESWETERQYLHVDLSFNSKK